MKSPTPKQIKDCRLAKGEFSHNKVSLLQTEAAKLINVSERQWSRWEIGVPTPGKQNKMHPNHWYVFKAKCKELKR